MASPPTVLIFTYSEHGQANVNLAISYELALAGVNVCIASFALLKPRVSSIQELVDRHASRYSGKTPGSITFREIDGVTSYIDAIAKHGITQTTMRHSHDVSGALGSYTKLGTMMFPWSQKEYLFTLDRQKEIIATIKPDLVLIDTTFYSAADACKLVNQKFMIIFPTGLKESVASIQPYLAVLWKYPVLSSGFQFPLKWWQVLLNIYLYIRLVMQLATSTHFKQIRTLRKSLGLDKTFGVRRGPGVTYISPALTEIDLPLAIIPKEIYLCGPIILPFDPLEERDPETKKWLDNGPTVLVNLGSHVTSDEKLAREMAGAFRILLDHHDRGSAPSKIQVLWKVKTNRETQRIIDEIIGEEAKEKRVRVMSWLDAEPVSILQHPNVICTVHHGGANSFYEGIWSGTPHVVLPVWLDTFGNATLAEYLNVGVFGSKTSAPGAQAEELGNALVRVTGNSREADEFRKTAKHLKEVCRAKGDGRKVALAAILKEAGIMK